MVKSSSQPARWGKRTEPPANKSVCAITRARLGKDGEIGMAKPSRVEIAIITA
jgi:hypothetical protein